MTEAKFQTAFTKWAKYNLKESSACELKLAKGNSLPFTSLAPHQLIALKLVKNGGVQYKIPDCGISAKPFDFFTLQGQAYIVVMFYKRRQREFYMIDIDTWDSHVSMSNRKSLTEEDARLIGKLCVLSNTV